VRHQRKRAYGLGVVATVATIASGCGWVLGLDEFVDAPPPVEDDQSGSGCKPQETVDCYEGPEGTEAVGMCVAGTRTCNTDGTGYGACQGQMTPAAETCVDPADEDCDSHDCVLWARMFVDVTEQSIGGVVTAPDGTIYVAGWFTGTLAFDTQKPISANGVDLYVARLDPAAGLIWAKSFPVSDGSGDVSGLTVDPEGNVAIAGILAGKADFDGTILSPQGYDSVYVAKLKPDGQFLWAGTVSLGDTHEVAAPATDRYGNILLVGIDACISVCLPETTQMWIRKLSPDGELLWHHWFDTVDYLDSHFIGGITADPFGNVLVTGSFRSTEKFGAYTFTSNGAYDIFLLKLDPNGVPVWKSTFGDANGQRSTGVASDHLGNILVTGSFRGSFSFGPDAPALISAGASDIFVVKLSSASAHLWSRAFGDVEDQRGGQLATHPDSIVLTAWVDGKIDFGGGALASKSDKDVALAKLTLDGDHLWSRIVHGDLSVGHTVGTAPGGEVLLAGAGQGMVDVGTGPITSAGVQDVLLARFAQ